MEESILPDELIIEILVRLPVKSLSRFKCVSKSWYALFTDLNFINLHYNRSIQDNKLSLLHRISPYPHEQLFYSFEPINDSVVDPPVLDKIHHPIFGFHIKGSCNGLFLVIPKKGQLIVWNPSIRERICLSSPARNCINIVCPVDFGTGCLQRFVYGLGYDSSIDDYKILQIRHKEKLLFGSRTSGYGVQLKIYLLRTRKWRKIEDVDTSLFHNMSEIECDGVFASGALHWIGRRWNNGKETNGIGWRLIAFDLGREEFREILLPKDYEVGGTTLSNVKLTVLRESIYLFSYDLQQKCSADIFVMKEYGVRESWCKLCTVFEHYRITPTIQYWRFLCFTNNGKILLQAGNDPTATRLIVYDPEDQRGSELKIGTDLKNLFNRGFVAQPYVQSLVQLKHYHIVDAKKLRKRKMKS